MPVKIVDVFKDFFNSIINKISDIFSGIGTLLDYLNPLSENFIFKKLFEFIGNFFVNLLDFFIHLFIPTEEQRQEIAENFAGLGEKVKNKLPFVGWFTETINGVDINSIGDSSTLKITVPSFSFFGGQTTEKTYIDVYEAYEPYRVNIRSKLSILVYLGTILFIVKSVLNLNNNNSSKGGEEK